jgi:hypothetical protein
MIEYGHILPPPGQEKTWFESLPGFLRTYLAKLGTTNGKLSALILRAVCELVDDGNGCIVVQPFSNACHRVERNRPVPSSPVMGDLSGYIEV